MCEGLTEKQSRFCEEYLVDLNATQAAIRAGYSEASARSIGCELLGKPEVQERIAAGRAEISRRTGITVDRVVAEIAKIAFSDLRRVMRWGETVAVPVQGDPVTAAIASTDRDDNGDPVRVHTPIALIDSEDLDDDAAAAIAEIRQTKEGLAIKLHDKGAALDKLMRHLGGYAPEKTELTGKDGGPVAVKDFTDRDRARALAGLLARLRAQKKGKPSS